MDLYYVTSNPGKFKQVETYLKREAPYINLIQHAVDLTEIQTLDLKAIAQHKAEQAWNLIKKPLLIDDGGFYFSKYNNFPGTLCRYVFEGIGLPGLLKLVNPGDAMYGLLYLIHVTADGHQVIFQGRVDGTVIYPDSPAKMHPTLPYVGIFKPQGSSQSYFEIQGTAEEIKFSSRLKAIQEFIEWIKEKNIH